jgi:hypothetical protein
MHMGFNMAARVSFAVAAVLDSFFFSTISYITVTTHLAGLISFPEAPMAFHILD